MYSNEYIDTTEIDTDRLENDLYDYYGTGAFAVSPAMSIKPNEYEECPMRSL